MKNPISQWRNKKKQYQFLYRTGKIISFTKVQHPPQGFGSLPYYTAIIEFPRKRRTTGQLVIEAKKPSLNASVKGVLRIVGRPEKSDIINYQVKYKVI